MDVPEPAACEAAAPEVEAAEEDKKFLKPARLERCDSVLQSFTGNTAGPIQAT